MPRNYVARWVAFGPSALDAEVLKSLVRPVLLSDFDLARVSIDASAVELDFVRERGADSPDGKVRTPRYEGFIIAGPEPILRGVRVASSVELPLRARRALTDVEIRALARALNRAMLPLETQGVLGSSVGWTIRASNTGGSSGGVVLAALAAAGFGYYLTQRRRPSPPTITRGTWTRHALAASPALTPDQILERHRPLIEAALRHAYELHDLMDDARIRARHARIAQRYLQDAEGDEAIEVRDAHASHCIAAKQNFLRAKDQIAELRRITRGPHWGEIVRAAPNASKPGAVSLARGVQNTIPEQLGVARQHYQAMKAEWDQGDCGAWYYGDLNGVARAPMLTRGEER